jgi:hypothetical protein
MARLTVSYSIAFIPGLPRPLALSEVIDDVLGLSSLSSRHTVRKQPGTPDRLDIVVPVEDLPTALDSAATAADELTRIGESLLGLGFIVEERAIRIDGLADNWLPDTFDGAGTRHHAPTALDAAAPVPDELDEPFGDVPDEDLRLDNLHDLPAADLPHDLLAATEPPLSPDRDLYAEPQHDDRFAASPGRGAHDDDRFTAPLPSYASPHVDPFTTSLGERELLAAARARRGGHDPLGPPARESRHPAAHQPDPAAARRRQLVRQAASAPPAGPVRSRERRALALFAVAFIAAVAPWKLAVTTGSIIGLAVAAAALAAGAALVWPDVRTFAGRIALTGTVTLVLVLTFASAYAICADTGDLRGTGSSTAVGQSLSAAVSLGAAPGLSLGPGARSVAYAERLLVLLALAGLGAHLVRTAPSRTTRRDLR